MQTKTATFMFSKRHYIYHMWELFLRYLLVRCRLALRLTTPHHTSFFASASKSKHFLAVSCWIYSFILSPLLIIANPCWRWSTSPGICPHTPIFQTTFSNPSNFFSSNFCSIFLLCHSFLSPFPSTSFPSFFASPALFRAPSYLAFCPFPPPFPYPPPW